MKGTVSTGLPSELRRKVAPLTGRIDVRKAKIKVLLVQEYPNFEYRYLTQLLKRDPTIDLRTVLQEADVEHSKQDASALRTFPVRWKAPQGVAGPKRFPQYECCRAAWRILNPRRHPRHFCAGLVATGTDRIV